MSALHKALLASVADKGSRLREVRKDLLRQKPGQTQRWFQGPDGCDLFLWYDERRGLSQIQLTVEQRVVEWTLAEGLRTGRVVAFNPLRPLTDQSRLEFDARPDGDALELARVLLESAQGDELTFMLVRKQLGLIRKTD
ncbi:MAG: hypothetical protein ABR567_23255 [Myxococcales bacterium]|nr:hypothetical protein [Myxococcales bacterium]